MLFSRRLTILVQRAKACFPVASNSFRVYETVCAESRQLDMYKTTRRDRGKETGDAGIGRRRNSKHNTTGGASDALDPTIFPFPSPKAMVLLVPLQLPKAPIVYHDVRRELYLRWDPVCTTTCMQAPASRRRAVSSRREGTLVHTVLIAWYRSVPVRTRVMFTTLWRGLDFDDADSMGHPP
jgi:hypothetical protein